MSKQRLHPSTALIHGGRDGTPSTRGSSPLIDRSSTFCLDGPGGPALESGEGLERVDVYGRYGTMTTRATAALVAELEHAEAGLVLASGMAAIASLMFACVPPGGTLAVASEVYGGTRSLSKMLGERGVQVREFDPCQPSTLASLLAESRVDLVFCESISNPLVRVSPLPALTELCRAHGATLAVDATFSAGMAIHPLQLGADLVVHSATKYLNGHSDVVAGVVCGSEGLVSSIFRTAIRLGGSADPEAAWLLSRGLRTLPLRWARQCETAQRLASALAGHQAVLEVHYPGLAAAPPMPTLAGWGGVLSFTLESEKAQDEMLARLELVMHAPSLGGLETLVCSPRRTSHQGLAEDEGKRLGIPRSLVRVSVGLEAFDDLWADFERALPR